METNNPYHVPTKTDKFKVISNHLKQRLSVKVKRLFEDKKGSAANAAAADHNINLTDSMA